MHSRINEVNKVITKCAVVYFVCMYVCMQSLNIHIEFEKLSTLFPEKQRVPKGFKLNSALKHASRFDEDEVLKFLYVCTVCIDR